MKRDFYPNSNKTTLIPRGVKHELFLSNSEPDRDQRFIISVANLVPKKGIELLLGAFNNIKNDFREWKVLIVGDDTSEYAQGLKKETNELGLEDHVIFTGKTPNVKEYLDRSEIFVLPTNTMGEGSPVAVLEAMANGKVVIGSAVPGIKDQLADFQEHLFPVNDINALTDRLKTFMSRSTKQNLETGSKFVDHVVNNYSFQREVEAHEEVYKKVAGIPT